MCFFFSTLNNCIMLKLLKYRLRSAVGEARHDSYGRVTRQVSKMKTGERKESI